MSSWCTQAAEGRSSALFISFWKSRDRFKKKKKRVRAVYSKRGRRLHIFIFLLLLNESVPSGKPGKLPCIIKFLFLKIRLDSTWVYSPVAGIREKTASLGKIKIIGNQEDRSRQSTASVAIVTGHLEEPRCPRDSQVQQGNQAPLTCRPRQPRPLTRPLLTDSSEAPPPGSPAVDGRG